MTYLLKKKLGSACLLVDKNYDIKNLYSDLKDILFFKKNSDKIKILSNNINVNVLKENKYEVYITIYSHIEDDTCERKVLVEIGDNNIQLGYDIIKNEATSWKELDNKISVNGNNVNEKLREKLFGKEEYVYPEIDESINKKVEEIFPISKNASIKSIEVDEDYNFENLEGDLEDLLYFNINHEKIRGLTYLINVEILKENQDKIYICPIGPDPDISEISYLIKCAKEDKNKRINYINVKTKDGNGIINLDNDNTFVDSTSVSKNDCLETLNSINEKVEEIFPMIEKLVKEVKCVTDSNSCSYRDNLKVNDSTRMLNYDIREFYNTVEWIKHLIQTDC